MCETCGCSDDKLTTITDLKSGAHIHLGEHAHSHGNEHGGHAHAEGWHVHPDEKPAAVRATLAVEQDVLGKNNRLAQRNREFFAKNGIFALNVMSSPGSGKTTLLERTIRELSAEWPISVIEGDQETSRDAERIRSTGAPVVQVNTGTGCHLDAEMVAGALHPLVPPQGSVLFVENVGNLVCPALFDLGESAKVLVVSVTEGEDKPLKYPHMFRGAAILLLNKVDLLPHVDFDVVQFFSHARKVNPSVEMFRVSAKQGEGMEDWYRWIRASKSRVRP